MIRHAPSLGLGLGLSLRGYGAGGFSGLLDQFPGAAAAYSLRSLSSRTTNVIRGRRISDNAEQDFTAAQITDGTLAAFAGTGDCFLSAWFDQSGNGNDLTQAVAVEQIKIVSAGVVLVSNGLPAVKGDGSSTSMVMDSTLSFAGEFDNFFVAESSAADWGAGLQRAPYGSSANADYPRLNSSGWRYNINGSDSGTINYNPGSVPVDTQFVFNFNRDGSDVVEACIDGVVQTNTATLPGNSVISKIMRRSLNTSQVWDGFISEFIFYASDQSANRAAIHGNINEYYGTY